MLQGGVAGYEGMLHVFGNGSDEERMAVFQVVSGLILGDETLAAEWIPRWAAIDSEQLVLAGTALLRRDDISARIGEIDCPVLTIHGTADQAISMERAQALAATAADHRGIVAVDGAAHAPNMTHPHIVNPPLTEFLASL